MTFTATCPQFRFKHNDCRGFIRTIRTAAVPGDRGRLQTYYTMNAIIAIFTSTVFFFLGSKEVHRENLRYSLVWLTGHYIIFGVIKGGLIVLQFVVSYSCILYGCLWTETDSDGGTGHRSVEARCIFIVRMLTVHQQTVNQKDYRAVGNDVRSSKLCNHKTSRPYL